MREGNNREFIYRRPEKRQRVSTLAARRASVTGADLVDVAALSPWIGKKQRWRPPWGGRDCSTGLTHVNLLTRRLLCYPDLTYLDLMEEWDD